MEFMHTINGAMSGLAALALCAIVLHPQIHEGPIIKIGLILMIFSLSATAVITLEGQDSWVSLYRAAFTLRLGIFIATIGVLIRAVNLKRKHHRRVTDLLA